MIERFGERLRASVHVPFALVGLVVLLGLLRVVMDHWRQGTVLLGAALLLAAALRAFLSRERVGLLAIRSRAIDIGLYGGLGLLIIYVAMTIIGGPRL